MAKPKKIEGLDCAAGATEGVRLVLASRFAETLAYRDAALDFSDIEGVHDMRVASRRLRSALRDFAPHVRRPKRLERVREDLKTLARSLGAVRDQDVAMAELERLAAEAPEEARPGVLRLAKERDGLRERARAELAAALAEKELGALGRRFGRAVEGAAGEPRGRAKRGGEEAREDTFAELGRAVVARSWDELRELGPSLYRPRRQKKLHRMRIAAKRLRYVLELFAACWGGGAKKLASEISDLQDALGRLHDCDEWIEEVGGRLARGGGVDSGYDREERDGLIWLLDFFVAERAKNYRAALGLWREWEREGFAERIFACAGQVAEEAGGESASYEDAPGDGSNAERAEAP